MWVICILCPHLCLSGVGLGCVTLFEIETNHKLQKRSETDTVSSSEECLHDNAAESDSSVSAMPSPPPPPPPLLPPPQDAALPRAVHRLAMMENQQVADSSPPPSPECAASCVAPYPMPLHRLDLVLKYHNIPRRAPPAPKQDVGSL